jgi:phage recombination protein Bet
MSTEIAKRQEGGELTAVQVDMVRQHVAPQLNDSELAYFLEVARSVGLNPLRKQIYAVKRGNRFTTQVSIDGYRAIAHRTGQLVGCSEPEFTYDSNGRLYSAKVTVKRLHPSGLVCEYAHVAFFDEYCQTDKSGRATGLWPKMPHTMLAKCAEACAHRKGFPEELAGIYTTEEMMQADNTVPLAEPGPQAIEVTPTKEPKPAPEPPKEPKKKPPYDGDWPRTHKRFCAALTDRGATYKDVADWCMEQQFGRPSTWPEKSREQFIGEWEAEHAALFKAWLAVKNGEMVEAEVVEEPEPPKATEGMKDWKPEPVPKDEDLPF